jgi:hypothetical protein
MTGKNHIFNYHFINFIAIDHLMRKYFASIFFLLIIGFGCYSQTKNSATHSSKKIALVIGVAKYQFANPLKNTINDARDIDSSLTKLGFNVTLLLDPTLREMSTAIDTFGRKMFNSEVCLFYYSGHGAEYNGENFLFPVTSHPTVPSDLMYEAYPLQKILSRIELSKIKTSIVILDACRSNPFARAWVKDFGNHEGLTVIDLPNGSFVGYAASPGKVASDGRRKNGTYTEAILKFIGEKDQSIDQLFNKVNKEVRVQTVGSQIPFKSSSLDGDFFFNGDVADLSSKKSIDAESNESQLLSLVEKKFPLPKIVKGYSINPISNYAKVTINSGVFKRNDWVKLNMQLLNKNIWDKTTPVFVTIVKKYKKDNDTGVLVLENQYQPIDLKNKIEILADLDPGYYEIRIGFYFISELNVEYPTFNSKAFTITIQE